MELRKLFRKHAICIFDTPFEDKELDNTWKIEITQGKPKKAKKVITVQKIKLIK